MAYVRVKGAARLRRTLKQAGVDMKELRAANRAAAQAAMPAAVSLAPKISGALAGNIRTGATNKAGILRAGGKAVPYAGVIHYGWPARGIRSHPFLLQATQGQEEMLVNVYMQHVNKVIDQIEGA